MVGGGWRGGGEAALGGRGEEGGGAWALDRGF